MDYIKLSIYVNTLKIQLVRNNSANAILQRFRSTNVSLKVIMNFMEPNLRIHGQ